MTPPDFNATRYLQNAGRQCPICLLDGVWHEHLTIRTHVVNDVRLILVPCHCTRCNSKWVEKYRLVGVHRSAQEAVASAAETYKAGP